MRIDESSKPVFLCLRDNGGGRQRGHFERMWPTEDLEKYLRDCSADRRCRTTAAHNLERERQQMRSEDQRGSASAPAKPDTKGQGMPPPISRRLTGKRSLAERGGAPSPSAKTAAQRGFLPHMMCRKHIKRVPESGDAASPAAQLGGKGSASPMSGSLKGKKRSVGESAGAPSPGVKDGAPPQGKPTEEAASSASSSSGSSSW